MTRNMAAVIAALLVRTTGAEVTDMVIDAWCLAFQPYPDDPAMPHVAAQVARTVRRPCVADFAQAWQDYQRRRHEARRYESRQPDELEAAPDDRRSTPEEVQPHLAEIRAVLAGAKGPLARPLKATVPGRAYTPRPPLQSRPAEQSAPNWTRPDENYFNPPEPIHAEHDNPEEDT